MYDYPSSLNTLCSWLGISSLLCKQVKWSPYRSPYVCMTAVIYIYILHCSIGVYPTNSFLIERPQTGRNAIATNLHDLLRHVDSRNVSSHLPFFILYSSPQPGLVESPSFYVLLSFKPTRSRL